MDMQAARSLSDDAGQVLDVEWLAQHGSAQLCERVLDIGRDDAVAGVI
jgi:hypothetical protein